MFKVLPPIGTLFDGLRYQRMAFIAKPYFGVTRRFSLHQLI